MSNKSTNSETTKSLKKIRNDLMNFAKKEILVVKNSHKQINITKFEDSVNKVPHSKYSSNSKKKENNNNDNHENASPKIEIVDNIDKNEKEDEVCSSDLSDEDN